MRRITAIILALVLFFPAFSAGGEALVSLDEQTIREGKEVFMSACNACHGLKYYREGPPGRGIEPLMSGEAAMEAFGVAPPDLSLMAIARGRGRAGARYIYELLTTYRYDPHAGAWKNRAFAEWTEGDGVIAMPPAMALDDPELEEKSAQVASFLLHVAMPELKERRRIGAYAMAYMAALTALLFAINRLTWRGVKKKG